MKKKLILMGACAAILILLFAGNVIRRIAGTNEDVIYRDGDMITVAESIELFSFLGINKEQMEQTLGDDEYLKFGQCVILLQMASQLLQVSPDDITKNLSFALIEEPSNKVVLTEEFLGLYEAIVNEFPEDKRPVDETTFLVLGSKKDSTEEQIIITDAGEYDFKYAKSYDVIDGQEPKKQQDTVFQLDRYIDKKIKVFAAGDHVVYVKAVLEEETVLRNVWIRTGTGSTVSTFLHNISKDFATKYELSQNIEGKVADIVIQEGKITKISIKPDVIQGKVLVANKDYIEVEGYGKLKVDENYKIYKIYNELSMEVTNSILVGYEATDFVVADGKIVAALITEKIKAENIRVLIKTNNFAGLFHDKVTVTSNSDFTVKINKKETTYDAGTELTFTMDDNWETQDRVHIRTKSEEGKIKLLSVKRANGNPSYRGSIEIGATAQGFTVINELPLEEYLYAVIPSEMPTYYGLEALKVQAICARSYAYNQLFANSYNEYGAHVDDSVSYQVYNNIPENEDSILAVKDTYGKVIEYSGSVITAYYFSTSSGHTASVEEVWGNARSGEYLVGKLQTVYNDKEKDSISVTAWNQDKYQADFSDEKKFKEFILNPEVITYDSEFPWYRWKVTINLADIKKTIDKSIEQRYNANPAYIQTLKGKDTNGDSVYESVPVSTIGTVKDIKVGKREKSGIISELILVGSERTIKVISEYNIRVLLAPLYDEVIKQDDTKAAGQSMLPSSFFVLSKKGQEITINGGGYGHGVGMSQNGVKAMTDAGIEYENIIKHYYTDVNLGFIY